MDDEVMPYKKKYSFIKNSQRFQTWQLQHFHAWDVGHLL